MKKFIVLTLTFAFVFGMSGFSNASLVPGSSSDEVDTSLTQVTGSTGSENPIIKAKWEMRECRSSGTAEHVGYYTDDSYNNWWCEDNHTTDLAQFLPSGDENQNTPVEICTVVAHSLLKNPDDLDDFSVSADVYYPTVQTPTKPTQFCGKMISEIDLLPLTREEGLRLACGDASYSGIRQLDPGLPVFGTGYVDDYDDICHEIDQQEAVVFCGPIVLSYEDPEGQYLTKVHVISPQNTLAGLNNEFTYLPLDAFKIDFTSIGYGNVALNTFSSVSGDTSMTTPGSPTISGTGNTVLQINVNQDDMGFSTRLVSGTPRWNVWYKARLGSTPIWSSLPYYAPDADYPTPPGGDDLDNLLDLSEIQKMDFGILVEKFLSSQEHPSTLYEGDMTISGSEVAMDACGSWPAH